MLIYTCNRCFQDIYDRAEVTWEEFLSLFKSRRVRTKETILEFLALAPDAQNYIKDVGGFVGGELAGGKRSKSTIVSRSMLTLDIDSAPKGFIVDVPRLFGDIAALVYSTHKHTPDKPRLRVVIPLDRSVDPVEYEAIARKAAERIGIEYMDTSTYQPERMMYWQSYPSDTEPICQVYGAREKFLCADTVLSEYSDWKDRSQWPAASAESDRRSLSGTLARVADPLRKRGPIGDFCRRFSPIQDGIAHFIPEYIPGRGGRYTYSGSSTSNGIVVYEDKWTYSFHDHDPAHYKLCNIFDLIVIHRFGGDINKATAFITEELHKCEEAEAELPPPSPDNELPRLDEVLTGKRDDGTYPTTRHNIDAIFLYHPDLAGLFAYDEFQKRIVLTRSPFWRNVEAHDNSIRDIDDSEVRRIFLNYGIRADKVISDGLDHEAYRNKFHPVKDYLESLEWDGTPRMASALSDFMGCPATEYTYAVSTLLFQAAVMRIYSPGCKFDYLIAIKGPQGLGKSTFCEKIAKDWFSDSLIDIRDKDALEGIQGVWIIEISELSALRNASPEAVKSFLSSCADRFRKSYGKRSENYPRSCIFIATTNKVSFLFDRTGNRRFLPVEGTNSPPPRLSVFEDLTESYVDQLWAEAYRSVKSANFKVKLYLPPELEDEANVLRDAFSQEEPQADAIRNFLILGIDEDWYERDVSYRRQASQKRMEGRMQEGPVKRTRISSAEIWQECFNHSDCCEMQRSDSNFIRTVIDNTPGWKQLEKTYRVPGYGVVRGFERTG